MAKALCWLTVMVLEGVMQAIQEELHQQPSSGMNSAYNTIN